MARYFAANSLAGFARSHGSITEVTTAGTFDSAFCSNSIRIPSGIGGAFIRSTTFNAAGKFYLALDWWISLNSSAATSIILHNGGTPAYRVNTASSGTIIRLEYWNGTAWVVVGGTWTTFAEGVITRVMLYVDVTTGEMALYAGGVAVVSGTAASLGQAAITHFDLLSNGDTSTTYFSQVMAADYDIRDSRFMPAALNGNSASNTGAATGSYTDINETILDDGTSLTVTAAGNKAGQTHAAITVPDGYIIGAAVVNGRGRANGSITDGKLGVRGSSGTNSSGSGLGYAVAYEPRVRFVESDPDTATAFTQAGFNAAEIYEEAV
jgi:hypothetical protein